MASRMPGSTPSRATPSSAAIASQNSVRRCCHSRRIAGMSASDSAAAMTIAPRVGWGTYCMAPVAKTRTTAMTAAPTTPVTCDRDPACSDTAVREPLVLTGKPWKKPAKMFAAPMPIISWSPRTRSPRRAAKEDDVDIVSARATTAMATAPRNSSGRSPHGTDGTVSGGKPCGSTPMVLTPVVLQVEQVDRERGEHHDDEHRGHLGQQPLQHQDADQ